VSLDKKSVVQIGILLLLVAGAGGVYLSQQDGGLDLSGLLPGTADAPPPATAPPPKPAAPAIPLHPARGEVSGVAFEPDSVVLESGVLAFVQAKEPRSAILVSLTGNPWEVPADKKYKYAPAGANAPVITINRIGENGELKQQTVAEKYTLLLEFSKENGGKLSGKLKLDVPGESKAMLAGTFNADIKGFRIIDGKPDLTADSTDTLEFLALQQVLKDDPDKPIDVIAFRDQRYTTDTSEKIRSGYLEMEYRMGAADAAVETKRFQFVKDGEWKVVRTLALNEIDEAHPHVVPGPKDAASRVLTYLAAKRLEVDAAKKSPKRGLYNPAFVTRHNPKLKLGVAETSYKLEPKGDSVKTTYLFRLKSGGWVFDRQLKANEKINIDTGKITMAKG
jgi:hypothetical protein